MIRYFFAFLIVNVFTSQAFANNLAGKIEELILDEDSGTTTSFNPPLLDGEFKFLAFSADENTYPAPISYSTGRLLSERANSACAVMTGSAAVSVSVDQLTDTNGEYLVISHNGVSMVDKFYPKTVYKPGSEARVIPVAYIKRLTCR